MSVSSRGTVRVKKKKKNKKKDIILNILIVVFVTIFVGSGGYLFKYYYASHKNESQVEELKELVVKTSEEPTTEIIINEKGEEEIVLTDDNFVEVNGKKILKKFESIYKQNNAFVGWITIDDTEIDYPVVQTPEDEEYYLRKDFEGNKSTAGTLFVDASSILSVPSDNILIYGHNMHTGKMFHDILKYEDEQYYINHKYIKFDTIYGEGTYEVIAAFKSNIKPITDNSFKYYQFFDASDEAEFDDFVTNCKALTPYEINTTAKYGDKLITLSTCSYHTTNGRFAVVAKKIK